MFRLINHKGKLKAKKYGGNYIFVQGSGQYTLVWHGGVLQDIEEYPAPKEPAPKLDSKFKPKPAYRGAK